MKIERRETKRETRREKRCEEQIRGSIRLLTKFGISIDDVEGVHVIMYILAFFEHSEDSLVGERRSLEPPSCVAQRCVHARDLRTHERCARQPRHHFGVEWYFAVERGDEGDEGGDEVRKGEGGEEEDVEQSEGRLDVVKEAVRNDESWNHSL